MHARIEPSMVRLSFGGLLDACTAPEIARVASLAHEVSAPAGAVLCHQGGAAHQCYVVLDGEADVLVDGRFTARVRAGEIVGELALHNRGRRSATVVAASPCLLAAIPAADYASLMEVPGFRRGVLRQARARIARPSQRTPDRPLAAA
jgi:CRP-like cAMP-binding protein